MWEIPYSDEMQQRNIETLVDLFEIQSTVFPGEKIKIKIVKTGASGKIYTGFTNIIPLDQSGMFLGTSGMGEDVVSALANTLNNLMEEIQAHNCKDFAWSKRF